MPAIDARLGFRRPPPGVSIGRHQCFSEEVRLDWCRAHGIPVRRRLTGGGALYHDDGQLEFRLSLSNPSLTLADVLERGARALVMALVRLGVNASFKFSNDVEVGGRKLASVFAHGEAGAWRLEGWLILEADVQAMLEALRVPTEKLSADGLAAARDRLAPLSGLVRVGERRLRTLLTESLAAAFDLPGLGASRFPREPARAEKTDDFAGFEGVRRTPGGVLHARVQAGEGIARVRLGGGVHVHPASLFAELEQALVGIPASGAETGVRAFFAARPGAQMVGVAPDDIAQALRQALAKARLGKAWGLADDQADALMLVGSDDPDAVLAKAGMVLVPYCAKATFCGHRNRDTCAACGKCAVGEAYKLARERRLPVRTILRYEHLVETLKEMKARGIQAYLGMCCRDFFIKRQQAFQEAGLPAVLMDISGANCYELKQEGLAYAGTFKAEARLDLELTRKVMRRLPKPVAK